MFFLFYYFAQQLRNELYLFIAQSTQLYSHLQNLQFHTICLFFSFIILLIFFILQLFLKRFGPYFCEPVVAGLLDDNTPFLSG